MSDEHFTVDGTLLEAWASLKSFKKIDDSDSAPPDDPGNPTIDFPADLVKRLGRERAALIK